MARIKVFDTSTQSWVYADKSFGKDGKSAYQYAKDGGYTGTEAEFAKKLASEDGSVPADWNAVDGEPGHVLNRTHYKKWERILPEMEVSPDDFWGEIELESPLNLKVGEKHRVNWNGTEYLLEAHEMDGQVFLGDFILEGNDPFSIIIIHYDRTTETLVVAPMDESTEVTLSVEKLVYEKLPFEYLPESLRSYTVIPKEEEITDGTIWELSETADAAAHVLYNGGSVYIDTSKNGTISKSQIIDYALVFDGETTILVGNIIHAKRIVSISFAQGTWTPPTV